MKMIPLLWRAVSVWLCLALVCWCPSYYVDCTESQQEVERPESSQDFSSEEESRAKSHHHTVEEHLTLPSLSLSENEQLLENDKQKEEQTTLEDKQGQYSEAFEVDEITVRLGLEEDNGVSQPDPESEQGSEIPSFEESISPDRESPLPTASSDPVSGLAAEVKDASSILNVQDSIPNSVSHDASEVTLPEVIDSTLPPADCEEEEANPYDNESSPPIVLENTSNVHTAGTKTHTDPPLSSQAAEHREANGSQLLNEQGSPVITDPDPSVSGKDPEDIPTFDEWRQKMMEMENKKTLSTHTSNNGGTHIVKKVQKNFNNYASVECGAKILGSNPEAKSTSAILMENRDMYMLNPCSNKIWFIIELCEPIQVKQLDIANFELFSSTPKEFIMSISDRYPTNKWLKLGTFHARDERTVQSFPLDEHLYAKYVKMFTKYIKVELTSHYGSEHFCPLSLLRVFGTSMVEEYEEIADPSERPDDQDDDLDYPPGYAPGEVNYSKNLIGSAKDVILNMVNNIAVNVLGGGPEMQGNLSYQEVNMTESLSQLEASAQTNVTDVTSDPDLDEVETSADLVNSESGAPTSEPAVTEPPTTDTIGQELSPRDDNTVIPVEKDEEEHISSTIILLDKEEELDEEKPKRDPNVHQQESLDYCAQLPLFSSFSCTASLQEYLQQQCLGLLFKHRKCQSMDSIQMIPSSPTPTWPIPPPPSACPEHKKHHSEVHQPHEKEQASEKEPGSGSSHSEAAQPPGNTIESLQGSMSEHPLLEPSQTSNLPKPTASDSFPASTTPVLETPQISEEPEKQLWPGKSHDVLAEEKHMDASVSPSTSIDTKPSVSATIDVSTLAPTEETQNIDVSPPEIDASTPTPDITDQSHILHPTDSPHLEQQSDTPAVPESGIASPEPSEPAPDTLLELEPSGGDTLITETKTEDLIEDLSGNGQLPRPSTSGSPLPSLLPSASLSDIYAEPPNDTEQSGNQVHGSSQKESVFMRLNNRIKALEMNMSLSGRYLEQLSQRYRKQMEEMQKAFNITIIKLQDTSRIAEEQDQRQTDSIQLLQAQLENVTQLVLNLSLRISELQNEVSDRQNYLLLSLVLCLCFCLVLFANRCRISIVPPNAEPEPPIPKSYTYCCPERQFSGCDDTGLKRSASYPLIHSESLQLATTEDPERLHAESLCPANRKKRRRKMKPIEDVEILKPSFLAARELCNGAALCHGEPLTTNIQPTTSNLFTKRLLQPTFRDLPSEGSSEGSSYSDDPSFCGITTACSRICDGLPPPKTRAEKRALRRRRPKLSCTVVDFLQAPQRDKSESLPISTIRDIMNREREQSSGTFAVNVFSGPV